MPSLTATAHCVARDCDWVQAGDPATVDKAAEKHTIRPPKHPTATVTRWAR